MLCFILLKLFKKIANVRIIKNNFINNINEIADFEFEFEFEVEFEVEVGVDSIVAEKLVEYFDCLPFYYKLEIEL